MQKKLFKIQKENMLQVIIKKCIMIVVTNLHFC